MLMGGTTSFGVVFTWEVLAILKGGAKSIHPLKRGQGVKSLTLS